MRKKILGVLQEKFLLDVKKKLHIYELKPIVKYTTRNFHIV